MTIFWRGLNLAMKLSGSMREFALCRVAWVGVPMRVRDTNRGLECWE